MYLDEGWSFEQSYTAHFGDLLCGHPYTEELAGPDGLHVHFWLPQSMSAEQRQQLEIEAAGIHDLVSCSYEPRTPEVRAWLASRTPPKGFILPQALLEQEGMVKVFWRKGERLTIDGFSLSALKVIYKNLNEANQEKLKGLIEAGPAQCAKAIEICFQLLNRK